ncbi:MAG: hypothetical protein HYY16_17525 [Planctomycetes bacterium]|nr:hypothetical protein [Planctomycetota bacterium]
MKHLLATGVLLVACARAQAQSQEEPTISASFKDGLHFKSSDGNFDGHIGGRLVTHFRDVVDRPEQGARASSDTFFIRQARLEATFTFWKEWEVKVQTDFPTGAASSTTGTLQDAWVLWKHTPEFNLRVGQFKQPFSQEETTSTRFIDFAERSALNRLVPARDIGVMVGGRLFDGVFDYELSVFNGQGRAILDGNDEKDVAARLRLSPIQGLRVGVAGSLGRLDRVAAPTALDFSTPELGVLFLDTTLASTFLDGERVRLGAELSWAYGPYGLRMEWAQRADEVDGPAFSDEEIAATAWYAAFTWIVTGEKKAQENRVTPAEPFDLSKGTWGAVELAFRVAGLEIDDEIFDLGLASAATESRGVTTFTLGVNWWPTQNVRVSPNVILERFDDDVTFTAGDAEDSLPGFLVRVQMDF